MSTTTDIYPAAGRTVPAGPGIVDCDVHNGLPDRDALKPHLDERWHAAYDELVGRSAGGMVIGARPSKGIFRDDARPPEGGQPGSSLSFMREQLLDRWDIRRAILSPLEPMSWVPYGELSLALHAALNTYIEHEWLERDDRLFGSIMVPGEDGERAAAEIHRLGGHERFVQVLLLAGTREPLGHPKYWPIYAAAEAHGLPVAVHVGGFSGQISGAGWFSYHLERHIGWPFYYQGHVVSLASSGVFARHPGLQVVLQEAGISWMPPLMWRLDRAWRSGLSQMAAFDRPPSELIREHFFFTTQPMDEPEQPEYLHEMLDQLGMNDRIMFASDYPHWDFDPPDRVLPRSLGATLREDIFANNAIGLYPFPSGAEPA
jgi:predicted TIM-barrel fold metal-dependent hydrolase